MIILGQDEIKEELAVAVETDVPALLVGETGTGKTSLVRELAKEHGRTYSRFSITGETTVDDFVGKFILKDGETKWQDGILLTAVKKGHYLVVDEVNAALPEILFVLHSLLDDDKYVVVPQKDNSIVKPHKDFRFFATMNPVEEYAGTKELNKAFMSRFAIVSEVKYPKREVEVDILTSRTKVGLEDALKMVDVAIGIRKSKDQDKIFYTMSTRDLIFWGKLTPLLGIHRSFRLAIKNKANGDGDRLEDIYRQVFSDYKQAEEDKLVTNIEYYRNEHKNLEKSKRNLKIKVKKEVEEKVRKELKDEFNKLEEKEKKLENLSNAIDGKLRSLKGSSSISGFKGIGLKGFAQKAASTKEVNVLIDNNTQEIDDGSNKLEDIPF